MQRSSSTGLGLQQGLLQLRQQVTRYSSGHTYTPRLGSFWGMMGCSARLLLNLAQQQKVVLVQGCHGGLLRLHS